jgi:hypothetical protein
MIFNKVRAVQEGTASAHYHAAGRVDTALSPYTGQAVSRRKMLRLKVSGREKGSTG